jgi:probable HAF family extracellular repeat protein
MKVRETVVAMAMIVAFEAALSGPARMAAQENVRYRLIDLGTLGGPNSSENVQSPIINKQGVVIGYSDTSAPCGPDCFLFHAFRWEKGNLVDLGTLPSGGNSVAFGINDKGIVIGQSENGLVDPNTDGPENRAVLWQAGQIFNLGTLGGNLSAAFAINNRRQVVGGAQNDVPDSFSIPGVGTQARAFLWQNGIMQDLGTLGGPDAFASSINDNAEVTGVSYPNTEPSINCFIGFPLTTHPFFWRHGKMIDLGTLGGTCAAPAGINNRGEVAGTSNLAGDVTVHPFLWNGEGLLDLGTLGGTFGFGNALNDAGEVVGAAGTPGDETSHAFHWKNGAIHDLGTIGDDACSIAHDINNRGQVVGASASDFCDPELHGFLWQSGRPMIDLNAFVPPGSDLIITSGETINDRGEIAGSGRLPNGDFHAIVLIPCDEAHGDVEGCQDADESLNVHSSRPRSNRVASGGSNFSPNERLRFLARRTARYGSVFPGAPGSNGRSPH